MAFFAFFDDTFTSNPIYNSSSVSDEIFISEDTDIAVDNTFGINSTGDSFALSAQGRLTGNSLVVSLEGDDASVSVGQTGGLLGLGTSSTYGVITYGTNTDITNAGEISGAYGIFVSEPASGTTISNSGLIATTADLQTVDHGAIHLSNGERTDITNSGTIRGINDNAVAINANDGSTIFLDNSGTVAGDIQGSTDIDLIYNTGIIGGEVLLGNGTGYYTGRGDGVVSGSVIGGSSADFFSGSGATDSFYGLGGADQFRGGGGDDELHGGDGNDLLVGGRDNDRIFGDDDNDRIWGGSGDDYIEGGNGADILRAGSGEDELIGGLGRDVLLSGSGADFFVWTDTAESALGSTRDAVRDFERGEDTLDLEAIAGGSLRFIGTSAFSGTANEVRYVVTAAGSSVVRVDENGDGVRDMEILVQYIDTLSESDFLI